MKYITSPSTLAVAQGSKLLFSDFSDGGEMWTGLGPRERRHRVTFDTAFLAAPSVMVGIGMWDLGPDTPARGDIQAENVARDGFDLVFRTWSDTKVARIRADWTAIGAVMSDNDWDVE